MRGRFRVRVQREYESFARFVREMGWPALGPVVALTLLAGSAAGALLTIANRTAQLVVSGNQRSALDLILHFAVFTSIFTLCRWLSFLLSNQLTENEITRLRTRVIDKLLRTELAFVDTLDKDNAYTTLAESLTEVTLGFQRLIRSFQEVFTIVSCLLYLATISLEATFISAAIVVCVALSHSVGARSSNKLNRKQKETNARLLGNLFGLIDGFKEVKLNRNRGRALFEAAVGNAHESRSFRFQKCKLFNCRLQFADVAAYVMLAAAVYFLPRYTAIESLTIVKIVTVLVFLMPSVAWLSISLYSAAHIDTKLQGIYSLEQEIDAALMRLSPSTATGDGSRFRDFGKIECRQLRFAYRDLAGNETFSVGPLDLQIRRGEITFIIGGNGAGKSTAFKLLTGLYQPDDGELLIDDETVPWSDIEDYRQIIAAVFADFYLFEHCHGVESAGEQHVADLLRLMKLDDKVTFSDGRFSTQKLSTGQRKRLALVVALIEDRQLYFLDEWAADQDRDFRQFFYRSILSDLKQKGKTVVAITHDERYFDVADNVLQLDLGQLITPRIGLTPEVNP